MKRKISILLALSMLLTSCITPAFAENAITETNEVIEETTEKTTEEIIAELPVSEEYSEEQELPEEETTLSEDEKYMLNIVLFTLSEGTELSAVKKDLKSWVCVK